ncbi:MAG: DEAD/DEAH box helicase [Prevotella sp.]|jgi:superfamily II DNA/RNA helicase|nr:DEAD/DEAH box helicase [Prevotella sp.]
MDIQKILTKLRITELNEMQQHAAEAITGTDGDVVLLSPTGTGKTLAYLLPLVQLVDASRDSVQALVITPGRELALQSQQVLQSMGSGIRSTACYGGRAAMDEHRVIKDVRPQIVFGTPGRLNDHLDKENISRYDIRYLIIDEFDKCLEMGFQAEMQKLIKSLPGLQRRILLSATNAEQIPQFVNMARKGTLIDFLPDDEQTSERVTLYEVHSPQKDKLDTLRQLLLSMGNESSIVFLNYRESVERVNSYLVEQGFTTSCFHGGLEQRQREDQLYRFSNGSANVLVATDLASRGLDIPNIQNIIHYHLPESQEGYIHRVGRTARWDATGRTFFILNSQEHIPDYVEGNIEDFDSPLTTHHSPLAPKMATLYIGKGKKDKLSKGDIVGFLCKKGELTADEIGRIDVKERYTYVAVKREKLQQVLRLTQGEKIKGIKTVIEEVR